MKKSNTLMFSYIAFLVITILAKTLFGWDGSAPIALAATTAGCIFAVSDLFNWFDAHVIPVSQKIKESLLLVIEDYKLLINRAAQAVQFWLRIQKETEPYAERDDGIREIFQTAVSEIERVKQQMDRMKESVEECRKLIDQVDSMLKEMKRVKTLEIVTMISGFSVFFCIIVFETLQVWLTPHADTLTIFAFALIMVSYYLKDEVEGKLQERLKKVQNDIEQTKKSIEAHSVDETQEHEKLLQQIHSMLHPDETVVDAEQFETVE